MFKKAGMCLALMLSSTHGFAEGYPTEETVRFVMDCMLELGGQNDHNLYTCVCRHDVMEKEIPVYDDYNGARIYERFKVMPGEKGAFFRDNDVGAELHERLLAARDIANAECPVVKHLEGGKVNPSSEARTYVD